MICLQLLASWEIAPLRSCEVFSALGSCQELTLRLGMATVTGILVVLRYFLWQIDVWNMMKKLICSVGCHHRSLWVEWFCDEVGGLKEASAPLMMTVYLTMEIAEL